MTLAEACEIIKHSERVDSLVPKQVYSIICDYGAFKENSRLQIITKFALQNGLWDLMKSPIISRTDLESLRNKLDFYGFSEKYIRALFKECGLRYNATHPLKTSAESALPRNSLPNNSQKVQNTTPDNNPLTDSFSPADIEKYFNSIIEVDYNSFSINGLTLQHLNPIKWINKGDSIDALWSGPSFSYEIIGSQLFSGALTAVLYDNDGFVRDVEYITPIISKDKYSIFNESKTLNLPFKPKEISKITLRINPGSLYSHEYRNAFVKEDGPILRFNGKIANEIDWLRINMSQVLYAPMRKNNNISFYLDFSCIREISRYTTEKIYALIIDNQNRLRQKFSIELCLSHITGSLINKSFMTFSEMGSAIRNRLSGAIESENRESEFLRIPFDEIGKIVFVED